ncbi:DNA-binding protein [Escherichia coli]|nr:DNA-binding protein [Escherichia coli]UMW27060.1 DNA-binding protein [Escherichia coli]HAH0606030.1 DNA-binding protein [Escherichia coli]
MTTEINYHALLERARNKVQSIEFALTQSAFAEIRAELENDLELARIALASLEVEPDERAAYELFMEKSFGKTVDRRRAKNGDNEYMAWDMALGWVVWQQRAGMSLSTAQPQEGQQ